MTDLVSFIRSRLDEREALARAALADMERLGWTSQGLADGLYRRDVYDADGVWDFIEGQSPSYVLADISAKRAILALHGASSPIVCDLCSSDWAVVHMPCPTVRLLALPFADHPDFREEWRP